MKCNLTFLGQNKYNFYNKVKPILMMIIIAWQVFTINFFLKCGDMSSAIQDYVLQTK